MQPMQMPAGLPGAMPTDGHALLVQKMNEVSLGQQQRRNEQEAHEGDVLDSFKAL
jgi:hypothetical protein